VLDGQALARLRSGAARRGGIGERRRFPIGLRGSGRIAPLARSIPRMIQPDELKKNVPLTWSTGTGTDVWEMFCAAISGDVETVNGLLHKDPSLVRCQYAYRTPLYFAVRENRIDVARFLLEHGADPLR